MKKKVVIVGYSGHAFVVADVILSFEQIELIGYLENEEKTNNPFELSYLGNDDNINGLENTFYFPAVGDNVIRFNIIEKLRKSNCEKINVLSKFSNISTRSKIGTFNFFGRNSIINTLVEIGDGCIINTGAIVEHESIIGDYVHLGPGSILCGNVTIGDLTFVGANTVIKQGIKIGKNVTIGAGSVVLRDIPDNEIWAGNPAKRIISKSVRKSHQTSESYILKTSDYLQWEELLNILPIEKQDIYFTPLYHKIQELENYGEAECFVYKNGNEIVLYPYLKNKITENYLPKEEGQYYDIESVYGYTGPLTNSTTEEFLKDFIESFQKYCLENHIVCGFTRFHTLINNSDEHSIPTMKKILDRKTVWVNTNQSIYDIWNNEITSKNRNIIRKAQQNNLSIEIISNPSDEEIKHFVDTYHYTMKNVNADEYYFFSNEYIKNTFRLLNKYTYLFNVLDKNKNIMCTSMFFHYKNFFHYHLSARTEYADNTANNFLIYNAIKFAQNLNVKFFHLGGGRSNDENDSLLKFKQSFSTEKTKFHIGKTIYNTEVYQKIISNWEDQNPEKKERLKNILLRYKL